MNRNYTNLLLASVFVLLASCASSNVELNYEQADRYLLAREHFESRHTSCRDSGGVMVKRMWSASRLKRITRHEYATAMCKQGDIF